MTEIQASRPTVFLGVVCIGKDAENFSIQLTRVPCINEQLSREASVYRVISVQHEPVGDDGSAPLVGMR